MPEVMLTVAEFAERLHIPRSTAYDLLDDKDGHPEVGFRQIGRRKIIPESEVIAYEQRVFVPASPSADVIQLRRPEAA